LPEDIEHVFDPYFTTKETGTGLGLTTAYSILDKHDGLLTVESEPGIGSRFTFYVPSSEEREETPRVEGGKSFPEGCRVLVMDDEEIILSTISRMLTRMGLEVTTASDGDEAVTLYRESLENGRRFDVVILDLTVPGGMGGRKTVRLLKEIDPNVRAIVASGYSNDDVMANHSEYGFCAGICKPFTPQELREAIQAAVAGSGVSPPG
jgi:CheY-like chemotaxis protein